MRVNSKSIAYASTECKLRILSASSEYVQPYFVPIEHCASMYRKENLEADINCGMSTKGNSVNHLLMIELPRNTSC